MARRRSTIENPPQVREFFEFVNCLPDETEREGFVLPRFLKLCQSLTLSPNLRNDNDFARLADILFLHGFLLSRDAF